MKEAIIRSEKALLPVMLNTDELQWAIVGNGSLVYENVKLLTAHSTQISIVLFAEYFGDELKSLVRSHANIELIEKEYEASDLDEIDMLIVDTGSSVVNEKIQADAHQRNIFVFIPSAPAESDFTIGAKPAVIVPANGKPHFANGHPGLVKTTEQRWKSLASKLILAFVLMIIGHMIISYLPLPTFKEIGKSVEPYINYQFLFFVLAGFLAQMVDGVLSMGYGVTSATVLMSFNVSPVAMSAAIHTSEIFTTGISGYSHYKFGNVNKKLFKHLVIPGVIGAILGAVLLIFLDDK